MNRVYAVLAVALWLAIRAGGASAFTPDEVGAFAIRPHPGAALPLAIMLTDEQGRREALGHFFSGKPVVLVLEYLRCKTFCGLTLKNLVTALNALPLDAGRDFEMLAISIDPRDTPALTAPAKQKYLALYHHDGGSAGIHFLTGPATAVRRIADTIGFPYQYDAATDQFIHPAGFVLVAPDGRISRYIYGLDAAPGGLGAGLAEAAQGVALSPLDRLFLLCHIEGAPLGRYTVPVMAGLMIGNIGAGTALIVIFAAIRRRRHG